MLALLFYGIFYGIPTAYLFSSTPVCASVFNATFYTFYPSSGVTITLAVSIIAGYFGKSCSLPLCKTVAVTPVW